ncbi:MAG: cation-translocating P-type ATPase [Puniceicoccales bacterium]|jgi:Cd2+/Zn2+-exporting ATPase|nr:cation-translocating P-type ATPase [Puniceicoccales bacterium]
MSPANHASQETTAKSGEDAPSPDAPETPAPASASAPAPAPAEDMASGCGCCSHGHGDEPEDWRFFAALAVGCAVLFALGLAMPAFGAPAWTAPVCFAAAMFCGGWDALKDSIEGIPHGKIDVHTLMLVVAVGAAAIGAWTEGVLLLLLFAISGAMEAFAMHRTRSAIDSLFKDQPQTALLVSEDGAETPVPVADLKAGDLVFVRPGDVFPADAVVERGETAADESSLTGESLPAAKQRGDTVFGGTANLWGAVRARVARPASESSREKIIRLIREAQSRKAPSQRFTDVFGKYFVPPVLALAAAMFFVWWLGFGLPAFGDAPDGGNSAFYRAMTLLVVSCPCALVLSIPSAILAAIASGARGGILFRGGAAIEKLAAADCVAFDKTGTLTTGEMTVAGVESFPPGREEMVLRTAAALEANATHPLARAICARAKEAAAKATGGAADGGEYRVPVVEGFQNMAGFGVRGVVDGMAVALGRRELLAENAAAAKAAEQAGEPDAAHTEVWLVEDGLVGRILLGDSVREESAGVLAALKARGIRTVMLTGDRQGAAEAVAASLGVGEVAAGLTPAQKVAHIRALSDAGHRVAMLGDGVNDAPSLAAAYVAAGMGARGADAAIEQCDVVLMNDRIGRFLDARELSERARRVIRQNLAISLGTIFVMVCAALGLDIPLTLGVVAHEGSTVVVCLNSLRLLLAEKKPPPQLREGSSLL